MQETRILEGKYIRDVVTRFFYRGEDLYFQVSLRMKGGEIIPLKEINDYSVYKKLIDTIAQARLRRVQVQLNTETPSLAMAG